MKKIISIILSLIIFSGFSVAVSAEKASYPEMNVSAHGYQDGVYQDGLYYIYGEEIIIEPKVYDIGLDEIYKGVVVYLDCNKEVFEYVGTPLGTIENIVRYSETNTGYMAEIIWTNPSAIPLYATFTMKVVGKDNPDVSVRAFKVTQDKKLEEMNISFDLPENKVHEKTDIPQIITSPQPPVFSYKNTNFTDSDTLYLFEPCSPEQIKTMLKSTVDGYEVKYMPYNNENTDYVRNNDRFVLEFEGRICDKIQIIVIGDMTNDGIITSADARLVLRKSAQLDYEVFPYGTHGDVNFDSKTTAADARMILRVAAQLDFFRLADLTVWQNQPYKVGPLVSASDGGYLWRCTVSEENAIEITEIIEQSVDNTGKPPEEIVVGAPVLQTFVLKPLKQGRFEVKFELIRPWETAPIKEFGFTIVADDIL